MTTGMSFQILTDTLLSDREEPMPWGELPVCRLFHGAVEVVRSPDVTKGAPRKDYGRGFYTTSFEAQAVKFAKIKAARAGKTVGCVSIYRHTGAAGLRVFHFDSPSIQWLDFVLLNRGFTGADADQAGGADIIIGPVANDTVGLVLNQLIAGTYGDVNGLSAKETAIRLLEPENLRNQVFFRTQAAIDRLIFEEAYDVNR
jgi:hypothetical protein